MQIKEILAEGKLPLLELEVLLAALFAKDRSWIVAHAEEHLDEEKAQKFNDWITRRLSHEPIAYITGQKEFYGRDFIVTPDVLIPRPSTEGLIDLALDFLETGKEETREIDNQIIAVSVAGVREPQLQHTKTIVDIGTGSGCIAITLALEKSDLHIIATDISPDALIIAGHNAEKHNVADRMEFRLGNLLEPIHNLEEPFIIVSNPPYIPEDEDVMEDVTFEPSSALFAGNDGGDVVRELLKQAKGNSLCKGVVIECREEQLDSI